MSQDEVEELIENLSTHVGISTALADDMLDAGQLVMWATNEASVSEAEAQEELNDISEDVQEFINEQLQEEDRDVEMVILGLWMHIQGIEQKLSEGPVEEDDGPDNPHDRMFA